MIAMVVDVSLAQIADNIELFATSTWGIILFVAVSAIYMFGAYALVKMVSIRNKKSGIKSLDNKTLYNIVKIITFTLILIVLLVVLQVVAVSHYYKVFLVVCVTLSYGLAIALMGLLAYRLFSWHSRHKSLVVFMYALSSIFIVVNAVDSLIYFNVVILDIRDWMYTA